MRLRTLENQMRVFMNPHDYEIMLESAQSRRGRLAMQIMGMCGLRVGELPDLIVGDIRRSTHPDVDLWFWPIYGKDTRQRDTDGKRREVWVPDSLKGDIDEYTEIEGHQDGDHLFRCNKRTLRRDVERARENAVVRTGNNDYIHVSPHDFRAYFATNMTLREGVKPEIVMELGGWDDESTFRNHYLDAKFDDIIQMHLAAAGLVEVDFDVTMTEYQELRQEIAELKEMIEDLDISVTIEGGEDLDDTQLDEFF